MSGPRIGSVCSGYEGLGSAIQAVLGGDLAFVADIDPGACALLAHRFPGIANLGDITAVDWASLSTVDVFAAGFPCQDVSAAGARAGLRHGTRSGLWHEAVKAVGTLRPSLVVIENVLGLLTARGDEPTAEHLAAEGRRDILGRLLEAAESLEAVARARGDAARVRACRLIAARARRALKRARARFQWHEQRLVRAIGTVLGSLAALGYDAEWTVVTASAAGACHRRARVFILAFPARRRPVAGAPLAEARDGEWLEPCESLFGATPFTGKIPASGSMAGGLVYAAEPGPAKASARLLPTPNAQLAHDSQTHRSGARTDELLLTGIALDLGRQALLKTPTAQLAVNGGSQHPDKRRAGGHGPTLADQVEHELLPTPMAADGGWAGDADGKGARASSSGYGLRNASREISRGDHLLPTPAARDGKGRDMPGRAGGKSLPETLLPAPGATDGKGSSMAAGRPRARGPRAAGDADLPGAAALLSTPRATDGEKGGPNQRGSSGDLMLPSAVMQFLPTPQATDGQGGPREVPQGRTHRGTDHGPRLRDVAPALLPTPRVTCRAGMDPSPSTVAGSHGADLGPAIGALLPTPAAGNFNDGESLESWEARRQANLAKGINGNGQGTPLAIAVQQAGGTDWGVYEAAIRRWEAVTGRPAPAPTVPGKTGMRLSPLLPEWMMGLPEGWITDVPGLSRNAMLKLAGNGVVPQQAVLALRILLDRAGLESLERAA